MTDCRRGHLHSGRRAMRNYGTGRTGLSTRPAAVSVRFAADHARLVACFAINAVHAKSFQDSERLELPDRSKKQKPEHPSNAYLPETKSLGPSRTLFEYSNPDSAAAEFGLYDSSVLKTQHASGPRTGVRGHLQFLRACCHSVAASPLQGLAPIRQAPAPFGRCAAPTAAELRRPPADRLVKSETTARPAAERPPRHRTLSRTPRDFLPRV
jgi:hypothetical protein